MRRFKSNTKKGFKDVFHNFILSPIIALTFVDALTVVLRFDLGIESYKEDFALSSSYDEKITYFAGEGDKVVENDFLKEQIDTKKTAISCINDEDSSWVLIVGAPEYLDKINFKYDALDNNSKKEASSTKLILNEDLNAKGSSTETMSRLREEALETEDTVAQFILNTNPQVLGYFSKQQFLYNSIETINLLDKNIALVSYADFLENFSSLYPYFYSGLQFYDVSSDDLVSLANSLNKDFIAAKAHPVSSEELVDQGKSNRVDAVKAISYSILFTVFFFIAFIAICMNIVNNNMHAYAVNMLVGAREKDIKARIGTYIFFVLLIPTIIFTVAYVVISNAEVAGTYSYRPFLPILLMILSIVLIINIAEPQLDNEEIIDNLYTE